LTRCAQAASAAGHPPWFQNIPFNGHDVTTLSHFLNQYFTCFYWSVTSLVKVPWITPRTWCEQLFTVFVILIGTFTFAIIIGQVTLLNRQWDMARTARSDRLSKMRTYSYTRNVPYAIQKQLYAWTVADQDFAVKYTGKARLAMLPASMRGPLLHGIYENVLDTFPFVRNGMSKPGVSMLLMKLTPLVLMTGMGLIEPNTASNNLYVLERGSLRVALPMDKSKPATNRKKSSRVSMSPARGVKGGGLGLKSTKTFAKFRVLERPGSTVGIADFHNARIRFPFYVDSSKTSRLFAISRADLNDCVATMSTSDAECAIEVLRKEHKAHTDGLKVDVDASGRISKRECNPSVRFSERQSSTLSSTNEEDDNDADDSAAQHESLKRAVDSSRLLHGRVKETFEHLQQMRGHTATIVQLAQSVGSRQGSSISSPEMRKLVSLQETEDQHLREAREAVRANKIEEQMKALKEQTTAGGAGAGGGIGLDSLESAEERDQRTMGTHVQSADAAVMRGTIG
jgi:hypothetical protein